ncbi:MAG: hypothetical protein R2734_09625 [Nocardioides sp.]
MELGALTVVPNVEVTGMDVADGHIARADDRRRHRGRDRSDRLRCLVAQAGRDDRRHIPLTPAVHQMISVEAVPRLAEREGDQLPDRAGTWTRSATSASTSLRAAGGRVYYAHRPILMEPEILHRAVRAVAHRAALHPREDFDPQLEQAYELMPGCSVPRNAEIRYAINGLLSLTPDGFTILGKTPRSRAAERRGDLDQGGPGCSRGRGR